MMNKPFWMALLVGVIVLGNASWNCSCLYAGSSDLSIHVPQASEHCHKGAKQTNTNQRRSCCSDCQMSVADVSHPDIQMSEPSQLFAQRIKTQIASLHFNLKPLNDLLNANQFTLLRFPSNNSTIVPIYITIQSLLI